MAQRFGANGMPYKGRAEEALNPPLDPVQPDVKEGGSVPPDFLTKLLSVPAPTNKEEDADGKES